AGCCAGLVLPAVGVRLTSSGMSPTAHVIITSSRAQVRMAPTAAVNCVPSGFGAIVPPATRATTTGLETGAIQRALVAGLAGSDEERIPRTIPRSPLSYA